MHAKKIQTSFGRKIFEKGFIPERGHLGSFWEGSKPLFEIVDIDLDGIFVTASVEDVLDKKRRQTIKKLKARLAEAEAQIDQIK